MTVTQIQHLLGFLGHYKGAVDGIWGPESAAACRAFQQSAGLSADGCAGAQTRQALRRRVAREEVREEFWAEIRYFTREEFRCQCGGKYCDGFPVEPEEKLVRTVEEIRRRLGVPVEIVTAGGSGVRCRQHNAAVGGVENSQHLYGRAADLHSSVPPERMEKIAREVMGQSGGIGLYSWGIHVDTGRYARWEG